MKRSGTAEKNAQNLALALVARRRRVESGNRSIPPVFSIDVDAAARGTTGVVAGSAVDGRKLGLLHFARGLARHANARTQWLRSDRVCREEVAAAVGAQAGDHHAICIDSFDLRSVDAIAVAVRSRACVHRAAGDHAALGLLFDRFQPKIARFVQRYVGGVSAEVDDLVQTTFLEALRAAASFRQQSSVQTWLFGIAANVARNPIRANTRRRAFLKRASSEPSRRPSHHEQLSF